MTKLTKKQRGFVKDYIETDNATEAVIRNYKTEDRIVAKSMGSENLAKPYIATAIEKVKASIAEMLPDELLTQVHLEGLNASNQTIVEGEVVAEKPDYAVRHKYLDSAYKIKGAYAAEKRDVKVEDKTVATDNIKSLANMLNELQRTGGVRGDGITSEPMDTEAPNQE